MIDIKPCSFVLRKYTKGSYEEKSKYVGVMDIFQISDKICYIFHAHGEFTKDDYKEIAEKLLEMGFEEILMERHGKLKTISLLGLKDNVII